MADSSSTTRTWLMATPCPLSTPADPQSGCRPARERPGARSVWRVLQSCSLDHRLHGFHRVVPHVGSLDDVDDDFSQILGMVTYTLDGLGHEDEVNAR